LCEIDLSLSFAQPFNYLLYKATNTLTTSAQRLCNPRCEKGRYVWLSNDFEGTACPTLFATLEAFLFTLSQQAKSREKILIYFDLFLGNKLAVW